VQASPHLGQHSIIDAAVLFFGVAVAALLRGEAAETDRIPDRCLVGDDDNVSLPLLLLRALVLAGDDTAFTFCCDEAVGATSRALRRAVTWLGAFSVDGSPLGLLLWLWTMRASDAFVGAVMRSEGGGAPCVVAFAGDVRGGAPPAVGAPDDLLVGEAALLLLLLLLLLLIPPFVPFDFKAGGDLDVVGLLLPIVVCFVVLDVPPLLRGEEEIRAATLLRRGVTVELELAGDGDEVVVSSIKLRGVLRAQALVDGGGDLLGFFFK